MKKIELTIEEIETLMAALNYKEMDLGLNGKEKEVYEKLMKACGEGNA